MSIFIKSLVILGGIALGPVIGLAESIEQRIATDPYLLSLGLQGASPSDDFAIKNEKPDVVSFRRPNNSGVLERVQLNHHFYASCKTGYFYKFKRCKTRRPLVIFFPGIGGSSSDRPLQFYAEMMAKNLDVHTLAIPSVSSRDFVNQASADGFVGYMPRDIEVIYAATRAALKSVRQQGYQIGPIVVMGYSMGALQGAHFSKLAEERGAPKVSGTVLMNPPVDLMHSLMTLDNSYTSFFEKVKPSRQESLFRTIERRVFRLTFLTADGAFKTPMELFAEAARTLPRRAVRFITGAIFHQSLLTVLEGAVGPGERAPQFRSLIPSSIFRLTNNSYEDYLGSKLLPHLQKVESIDLDESNFNQRSGLLAVQSYLKKSNTYLIHNRDDYLLRDQDIPVLENVFGDRLTLFDRGGHLGNMASPDYIKTVFQALKKSM